MKKVLLYITMLLFAALLSAVAVIGKDWLILIVGGLAVLVLVGMGVLIEDK